MFEAFYHIVLNNLINLSLKENEFIVAETSNIEIDLFVILLNGDAFTSSFYIVTHKTLLGAHWAHPV